MAMAHRAEAWGVPELREYDAILVAIDDGLESNPFKGLHILEHHLRRIVDLEERHEILARIIVVEEEMFAQAIDVIGW
jgi:hypothetical protein